MYSLSIETVGIRNKKRNLNENYRKKQKVVILSALGYQKYLIQRLDQQL